MSGRENNETLFSFELLVESIKVEKESQVSDELALGVRLLDFPTLLIYQPEKSNAGVKQHADNGKDQQGEYAFNRGKSCFFKMNLNSLHTHLSNTPLYAMVLDVKEEIPKLVGSSLVSLAKAMDRIRQDVNERGVSTPSSHGESGVVGICDLMGEKIGSISLSYKLLSLGASLLPHITESSSAHGGKHLQNRIMEKQITESAALDENTLKSEDKRDNGFPVVLQTENKPGRQMPPHEETNENNFEDDLSLFCPPHLFYNNSAEKKHTIREGDCNTLNLDSEAFPFEDTEDETSKNTNEVASSPVIEQKLRHEKTAKKQETCEVPLNVLGEAVRQLPLLNALLVELSQLNGQNSSQPLSIHPNLSWIYRPASTEPTGEHGNTPGKVSLQKTKQRTSQHLKHVHSPRYCSTPASIKERVKKEEAEISSKSPHKKLVYGTTRTFNLRLKKMSPLKVKRRECMDLIQSETQSSITKAKTKSSKTIVKSSQIKSALDQSSSLNENVETMMQNIAVDSEFQDTFTLKHGKARGKQNTDFLRNSAKSLSEKDLKCIHIPSVEGDDVTQNEEDKEHLSDSNQVKSQPASHRHTSPKSSFSDSSREGNEEADYADDFNSLEPSDAYSPDPVSSPEPSRAKTPCSPLRHSDSEWVQKRAVLPVPVKAPHSPQHALRGAHIIRPRTQASALSLSSDDSDQEGSSSLQTICSRKPKTWSSTAEKSSDAESLISSRGKKSGSSKNSGPVGRFSAGSVSSFEQQEIEELEDELGSLDFKKGYKHISELVANKLPGYTM
ncbi:microtubule-associated protein 10 [Eleginops maclovinus]|uniref:microtubule-associated protein 10 n=1 Tax=Eleginops maclovinus TaxID=56733 RepID=UPI003080761B